MSILHTDTVTVFNRYDSEVSGENYNTWYPTVIKGVKRTVDKAARQNKSGLENADAASLSVPYKVSGGNIFVTSKQYLPPKDWDEQVNENLPNTITFTEGEDFFIRGEYGTEPIRDADYRGGFYNYINSHYDDVFLINSVGFYKLIPHFEISGK